MKLTRDEIILLVAVLLTLLLGATVKHYRARARLAPAPSAATPASHRPAAP